MNEIEKLIRVLDPTKWLPEKRSIEQAASSVVKEVARPTAGSGFVRLAGVSGALAVVLGAYGAHGNDWYQFFKKPSVDALHYYFYFCVVMRTDKNVPIERVNAFETGQRYHMIHSVALLAVPLTRRPYIVSWWLLPNVCSRSENKFAWIFWFSKWNLTFRLVPSSLSACQCSVALAITTDWRATKKSVKWHLTAGCSWSLLGFLSCSDQRHTVSLTREIEIINWKIDIIPISCC